MQYQRYFHRTLPIPEHCSLSTHCTWKPSCSGWVGRLMYGTRHPGAEPCNHNRNHVSDQPGREQIKAYHHLSMLFIHLMSFKIVHQLPENMTWTNMYLGLSERNSKEKLQFPFQIQSQKSMFCTRSPSEFLKFHHFFSNQISGQPSSMLYQLQTILQDGNSFNEMMI